MAERNESTLAGSTSRFQYTAGVAALLEATIHASAIVYFLIILEYASVTGAAEMVELLVANETSIYVMNLLTYVIFGVLLVVGGAGLLSAVPTLGEIGGGVFGVTQLVWFVGLGILLLRNNRIESAKIQYPMVSSTTDRIGTRSSRIPGSRRR